MICPRLAPPRAIALAALPLLAAATVSGCDFHGDPLVILPEFDDVSSFESDLGKWTPRALDLGTPAVAYEVTRSAERASDGMQSVRVRIDNAAGAQPKVLLERRYETEKNQTYQVDVSFDLASADSVGLAPWRVMVGAAPDSPTRTLQVSAPGDTGNGRAGSAGWVWGRRTYSVEARTDADAELFVYVGVWATSAGARTYYLDHLEITLTRKGITTTPIGG